MIVILEKTPFDQAIWTTDAHALEYMFERVNQLGRNDIYTWLLGWTAPGADAPADVKISVIRPATEAVRLNFPRGLSDCKKYQLTPLTYCDQHICKYSAQDTILIQGTLLFIPQHFPLVGYTDV